MQTSSVLEPRSWLWRNHHINYCQVGTDGPAVLLIHGFGASIGHWRRNLPDLAQVSRCYAIDLIGFGASAKPTPGQVIDYTFETWAALVLDFCREVIGSPAVVIANSIGCIVGMQAAVLAPDWVRGLALLNCSLRLLHERKQADQPWFKRLGVPVVQQVLQNPAIGYWFFNRLATAPTVRNVLRQAYGDDAAVTPELVEILLKPARDQGAADVFLAFTAYSQGPLPEDLLPQLTCPTLVLWGEQDPWEPIALGRAFANYPAVKNFIMLPGVGHCPQDEAPGVVNPILCDWIQNHLTYSSKTSTPD